jgi:23S rRNA (uridine2552-2'-O)-methyltransferase
MKRYQIKSERKKNETVTNKGELRFRNIKQKLNAKGKKQSCAKWLSRHINDPFVKASRVDGYVSRAAYKLIEIEGKFNIFKKNTSVILDLGCSPGSWIQVVAQKTNNKTTLIGVDLLDTKLSFAKNFNFIKGDILDNQIVKRIKNVIGLSRKKDQAIVILSDIAPNSSGDAQMDRMQSETIIEAILNLTNDITKEFKNSILVCKAIKGSDSQDVFMKFKNNFIKVERFKPKSSRKESSEMYIVAQK